MYTQVIFTLLTALAAANAQGGTLIPCTTTIRTGDICGCGIPAHTATALIDCYGCKIQDEPGPRCDIVCETSTTVLGSTTTVTSCSPSSTPCTTTFTSPAPAFGCTTTVSKHTKTDSVNCHGCEPTTVTASIPHGPGPVCVGGRKTVTATGTATVTTCAAGTE